MSASATDQHYTREDLAERLVAQSLRLWPDPRTLFVEPAAGRGAFVRPLMRAARRVRAVDLDPQFPQCERRDFLEPRTDLLDNDGPVVVIGNPPFGHQCSLVTRFMNRAALHRADVAFIVPRTLRKASVRRRLSRNLHPEHDEDLPAGVFETRKEGRLDVSCAWQVWRWREDLRAPDEAPDVSDLIEFCRPDEAEFAVRSVGRQAGMVISGVPEEVARLNPKGHIFAREVRPGVQEALVNADWGQIVNNTANMRSLAQSEVAAELRKRFPR